MLAPLIAIGSETGPTSTPVIRLMDAETGTVVAQTLAFEATFRGGVRVAMGDVDGDGSAEILAGSGPGRGGEVRVFKPQVAGGSLVLTELTAFRTQPFGAGYRSGLEIACGDVDGNGREDIVAAMSRGNGVVRVFRSVNAADPVENTPFRSITAFGGRFGGGASVTVADLGTFSNGAVTSATAADGKVEIVVASGAGMRATVMAYDVSAATPRLVGTIRPLAASLQGGVSVTAGRYDADAIDDIIVSAGRGGGGATEIYTLRSNTGVSTRAATFSAFGGLARPNAAVFAAALDRNGDGRIDRFFASQGDAGGSTSILAVSESGTRLGSVTSLAGPFRLAVPRPTITTTSSGLQYRVLVAGTGATAANGQVIRAHYTGSLTDGTIFDSSRARGTPFEFTLGSGQVIAGWDEAFLTMKVGERRLLVIPPSLGYGGTANGNIPANSTLVFDVELLEVRANSPASIGGTSTGSVAEDSGATVGGTLTVTDTDAGQAAFAAPSSLAGTYGGFTFNPSTGVWGYSLDNSRTATQALAGGQSVTDSLTVTSLDGSASRSIDVSVAGSWDAPTDISLSSSGIAENAAFGTAVGTLSSVDVDVGDSFTYSLVAGTGDADNASFTIDGGTLRTAASFDFEARSSYSIRVRSTDQGGLTTEKVFTLSVTDINESAAITGAATGSISAAGGGTTTGGTLGVTDPDAGQASFATPASLAGVYGSFTFDPATGTWSYSLDAGRPATAMLTASQTVTDSLTVASVDGTANRTIDVSITGYTMQSLAAFVATPSPSAAVPGGAQSSLEYRDVTIGSGMVASAGRTLTVNYVGRLLDGTVFDSSLLPGRSPLTFTLGVGQVIRGWDAGVDGMQAGGVRVLVIPPELAYGDAGAGTIPAGSTLVFYVEVLSVA